MGYKNRIVTYFMLSIQRIFIIIRSQIRYPCNINLLEVIYKYSLQLKSEGIIEFGAYKADIITTVKDNIDIKKLINGALKFNNITFITDNLSEIDRYLAVISIVTLEICKQLENENFDRAYDLVDAFHCLPEAIINKKQWNPNEFWDVYVNMYRKKWDKDFLSTLEIGLLAE